MAELSRKLLSERKTFKAYPQMASNTPITSLDICYKPSYDYVYLYPLREDPKFQVVYETQKFQTVWFQVDTLMTPPWFTEEERKHHELLISAVHEIARLKEKEHVDFLKRTYEKAPNVGSIDSMEQFKKRFPKEDPNDFSFDWTGSQDLIRRFGNYQRWHKSGYDVPYYGNRDVYQDAEFTIFPETFLEFKRKPPASKETN